MRIAEAVQTTKEILRTGYHCATANLEIPKCSVIIELQEPSDILSVSLLSILDHPALKFEAFPPFRHLLTLMGALRAAQFPLKSCFFQT